MKTLFRKIGVKLIIAVGFTALIIMGVYSYFAIQNQNDVLTKEVERHANQLSETIKKSMHYDMLSNNREAMHKIINSISREKCITNVRILNKQGEIIYAGDENDIGKMVDKNAEACYGCHAKNQPLERLSKEDRTRIYRLHPDSSRTLGVINPIYNKPSCWEAACHAHPDSSVQKVLGVLDVNFCLEEVDSQIVKSEINILIFAIFSILAISLIIGYFVRRWVDKPVKELVKGTNQVAVGNLNYRIKYKRKDELGTLSNSFNNMIARLSEIRMQLFQSVKMASLGRLAAGVAHEINNPLTGVLTYSSFLLKRAKKENPDMKEDLEVIVRETKRSREIVKGLLDFARQSTPKKNKIDINEVIKRVESVVSNQLTINHVKLKKNLDDNLPEVTIDANQMQQVFINLIVNSIDAVGPDGGVIAVEDKLIKLSPYGIKQIKQATCYKNHSIMDSETKIEGMPSIKVKVKTKNEEGFVNLDPIYGRQSHQFSEGVKKDDELEMHCPHCDVSMMSEGKTCPECESPLFNVYQPDGSVIEYCSNFICGWQQWEKVDKAGKQRYIEVEISDTGSGISSEYLNKIFDPFFSTKDQKGTGLGLSVIWGIIDNHDGKITVDSELGKGTTFKIQIPVSDAI